MDTSDTRRIMSIRWLKKGKVSLMDDIRVQAIIIKDGSVLFEEHMYESGNSFRIFPEARLKPGENETEAILALIRQKLMVEGSIVFRFSYEPVRGVVTFLAEVPQHAAAARGLVWVPLGNQYAFAQKHIMYLSSLMQECAGRGIQREWVAPVRQLIFNYTYSQREKRLMKRSEEENRVNVNERIFTLILALFTGIVFDYLFYNNNLGISYPVFVILFLGFFMYSARGIMHYDRLDAYLALAAILLLSVNFAIHSNRFLGTLNFLMVPMLIIAYTILSTYERPDWSKLRFIGLIFERAFREAFYSMVKPFTLVKGMTKKENKENSAGSRTRKSIAIGLLISLPILLFVVPLLISADLMFKHYLNSLMDVFTNINLHNAPGHMVIVLIVSFYVFGYIWSFKYSREDNGIDRSPSPGRVDPVIIMTVLTVVNLVYLLFTAVQSSYLYGGARNVLPEGFTYAEYARRGFFELVLVTIINFLILQLSLRFSRKSEGRGNVLFKILLSLLVVFTCNMLFAAHYKLSMYEESLGYTELRIYVHVFMLLMAVLFIIALARIWYERIHMFKASMISAAVIYIVLNYMNVRIIYK
jgi:heme/copper-type cytochrome/quinol oxidase subunit 2